MRLRRHVAQRETAQHAADRHEHRRHHVLDALALGRQQRRDAVEKQRQTEEIEQSVADAEPAPSAAGPRSRNRRSSRTGRSCRARWRRSAGRRSAATRSSLPTRRRAPTPRAAKSSSRTSPAAGSRRARARRRSARNAAEDRELPRVEQHAERQPAALVNQQRHHRPGDEPEQAAAEPAERHADRAARVPSAGPRCRAAASGRGCAARSASAGRRGWRRAPTPSTAAAARPAATRRRSAGRCSASARAALRSCCRRRSWCRRTSSSSSPTSPASCVCSGWPVKIFLGAGAVSIAPRCSCVLIALDAGERAGNVPAGDQAAAGRSSRRRRPPARTRPSGCGRRPRCRRRALRPARSRSPPGRTSSGCPSRRASAGWRRCRGCS